MNRLGPLLLLLLLLLAGCADWDYYRQTLGGQWDLMRHRRPIAQLLADQGTPPGLRDQLRTIQSIRTFASAELALPDNDSYRSWADIGRPYVVWNVVATPEFSLHPRHWCYPFAGCVPYRGFYSRNAAQRYGRKLRQQGDDVYVYGVPAYSTLRWFSDPVLNTFGLRSPEDMAALIFHELAHQRLYVPGDSAFNEAYATAVETEGVLRWLERQGQPAAQRLYLQHRQREQQFVQLLLATRGRLTALYRQPLTWQRKRAEKRLLLRRLHTDYQQFRLEWGGFSGYDGWMEHLSNARLAAVATYQERAEAFRELLRRHGGDFAAFHAAAAALAAQPPAERQRALAHLGRLHALHAQRLSEPKP